ncbi:MAG: D-sedoheptulose 7-phosphate isomerase [Bacilli bacterium]|nr:D-sedoheptulose 7-phosphate isomerase [Bacilli bacterium]
MKERINEVIDEQITNLENLKKNNYDETLIEVVNVITDSMKKGGKLMIAGNGGSAADSQHFAAELVGRFMKERKGLPAIALTTDSSVLTCMGNDYGYDSIIRRQVEALGRENDVFIGISTSGNSSNIIEAVMEAKEKKIITIGLLGRDGGKLKDLCDYNITFPYSETSRVQEHHLMTYHLICEFVENNMMEN